MENFNKGYELLAFKIGPSHLYNPVQLDFIKLLRATAYFMQIMKVYSLL
jgi:hypothetical protein